MLIKALSPSKLKQARLCEARLQAVLEDDLYSEEAGEGAKTGTLAHEAAMIWYRPNEVWVDAMQEAQAQAHAAIQQHPPQDQYRVWTEMLAMAQQQLASQGIVKHSMPPKLEGESDEDNKARAINDAFEKAIASVEKRDMPSDPSSIQDAKSLFCTIIAFYERSLINVLFAERRYKGTLANGVPVHLIIDLIVDRGNGELEVIDYKTGFITMNTDEMYDEDQVLMNLLAMERDPLFAGYTRKRFTYFWARQSYESGPVELGKDRLNDYETWLSIRYQYMLDCTEPRETINQFCTSCGRRLQCKNYLQLITEAMARTAAITEEQAKLLSVEDLMAQYSRLKSQADWADDSRKLLGRMLMGELDRRGVREIEGTAFRATKQQKRTTDFRTVDVLAICQQKGLDPSGLLSPRTSNIREQFGTDTVAMGLLDRNARTGMASAYVLVKEVKVKTDTENVKQRKPRKKKGEEDSQIPVPPGPPAPPTVPAMPEMSPPPSTPAQPAEVQT